MKHTKLTVEEMRFSPATARKYKKLYNELTVMVSLYLVDELSLRGDKNLNAEYKAYFRL